MSASPQIRCYKYAPERWELAFYYQPSRSLYRHEIISFFTLRALKT